MRMERLKTLLVDVLRQRLATAGRIVLPAGGELVWQAFCDLTRTRTYHAAGPNPIGYVEIDVWARLSLWPIEPHHVALIRALDDAWLEHHYAQRQQVESGVKRMPPVSQHAISPALFDAVFG